MNLMTKRMSGLLLSLLIGWQVNACTSFFLHKGDQMIMGRNYDFDFGDGWMIVNPKGLQKTAVPYPNEVSAKWTAKYGSIIFSQVGREGPTEGMNEAGLVIACLMQEGSQYPAKDNRPMTDELQWMQYQLDNFSAVQEVIASDKSVRITNKAYTKLHYMVADVSGNFAVIEFLNGKMVAHLNDYRTKGFICNDTFEKSASDMQKYKTYGGALTDLTKYNQFNPEEAVSIGSSGIAKYNGENLEEFGFEVLENVRALEGWKTNKPQYGSQWSVIYDLKNKSIAFKTRENRTIKRIQLSDFSFDCSTEIRLKKLNELEQNVKPGDLITLTRDLNLQIMIGFCDKWFGKGYMPVHFLKSASDWTFGCSCDNNTASVDD